MACLTNLKVKKVSFVRRGANRREFFLAKSADYRGEGAEELKDNNDNNSNGGAKPMRAEVRLRLGDILKQERDVERVSALLKSDGALKVTDAEIAEVRDFVSLIPPPDPQVALEMKKQADAVQEAVEKQAKAEAELLKIREDNHAAEVKKWVDDNCKYLNITATEATEQILKAEKVDLVTAETLKKSFKSTSDALAASVLMKEVGRNGAGEGSDFDPIGGNIVSDVAKIAGELQKSSSEVKKSDTIVAAIKSIGANRYENYRKEFNRRARTS